MEKEPRKEVKPYRYFVFCSNCEKILYEFHGRNPIDWHVAEDAMNGHAEAFSEPHLTLIVERMPKKII